MGDGEVGSARGSRRAKSKYTEAEILADHSIWGISDESDEENNSEPGSRHSGKRSAGNKQKEQKNQEYNQRERNKNWYDDPDEVRREEVEMARFLIEQAPTIDG